MARFCSLEENAGRVAVFAIILAGLLLVFTVTVDCNRYWSYCPRREFNDSIGPPRAPQVGDRVICRVENVSARPIPPGRLEGHIFKWAERSRPAWIFYGILNFSATFINLVLIFSHPKKRRNENTESRSFSHHQSEYSRISRIIYACQAIVIVHQAINVVKIVDCRPENRAEIFHTVMLALDVSVQGKCYVLHTIQYRQPISCN
ncbi:uncharacterized protein LOC134179021 [Corticium candelabrum]|uniref:uncharacterized protein LOC134179021 n=1 Tax=Corticium candelabrum TaxID=121492 RepID=UPI002E2637FF|nr:uncharacterized protein LOC134179021 [Corticium candelabrum]